MRKSVVFRLACEAAYPVPHFRIGHTTPRPTKDLGVLMDSHWIVKKNPANECVCRRQRRRGST